MRVVFRFLGLAEGGVGGEIGFVWLCFWLWGVVA